MNPALSTESHKKIVLTLGNPAPFSTSQVVVTIINTHYRLQQNLYKVATPYVILKITTKFFLERDFTPRFDSLVATLSATRWILNFTISFNPEITGCSNQQVTLMGQFVKMHASWQCRELIKGINICIEWVHQHTYVQKTFNSKSTKKDLSLLLFIVMQWKIHSKRSTEVPVISTELFENGQT